MSRTFRDYELREQRAASARRRAQRRQESDQTCSYLLGRLTADLERTFDPDEEIVALAHRIAEGTLT